MILKVADTTESQFFDTWGLPLTFVIAFGVYAGALTAAKSSWFAMDRPFDPIDEVDDPWEVRVRCHRCDKHYLARETDRDPSAGHQAICAGCATGRAFYAAARKRGADAAHAGEGARMSLRINSDIGEAYGAWALADDEAIMAHLELANVACGFHAGDPMVMADDRARCAKRFGVEVGAHPSYPDLQGFGRRAMAMDPDELTAAVVYQCGALKGFLDAEGMALTYVKPHGALYGAGARDETVAARGRRRRRRVRRADHGHGRHRARVLRQGGRASASWPSTTPTSSTTTTAS